MDDLTEEEKDIVRRARNAENHHLPKRMQTQRIICIQQHLKGLVGYLYTYLKRRTIKKKF